MKLSKIILVSLLSISIAFGILKYIDYTIMDRLEENNFVQKNDIKQLNNVFDNIDEITVDDIQESLVTSAQLSSNFVVSVNVLKREHNDPRRYSPLDQFFGLYPRYKDVQSIGTGVIITEDGYLVTNSHVVEKAIDITIVLDNGDYRKASIIGRAPEHDIAVLKMEGNGYHCSKIADSDKLVLGQFVYALGNPYGFVIKDSKPTLSFGVISAMNRNFSSNRTQEDKVYKRMIQTDAAINPGNSGGPLLSLKGEVVGINTFILSGTGGSVGIGFAIPINRVKKVVYELVQYGRIRDIEFGFRVKRYNRANNNKLYVRIASIQADSPCEKAGLEVGDYLYAINGISITEESDIDLAIIDTFVGDEVELQVFRNKELKSIKYKVSEKI